MQKSLILIISGPPAAGKTTLAQKIAKDFCYPLISKDKIKEILFRKLGWGTKEWSIKLGDVSYELLYYFLEKVVKANSVVVAESNFDPQYDRGRFLKLKKQYNVEIIEIYCVAKRGILWQRYKKRIESGERHPGFIKYHDRREFYKMLSKVMGNQLAVNGEWFELDSTNPRKAIISKRTTRFQKNTPVSVRCVTTPYHYEGRLSDIIRRVVSENVV